MTHPTPLESSFRDPAGFVFSENGLFKRAVLPAGDADYHRLMASGLYASLVADGLLVPHTEQPAAGPARVLVPQQVPFISYPYEWSFTQLQDAALALLAVERRALAHGLTLKDASAFNIQFLGARPIFIDTLSFTSNDGGPWPAYEQFCRHFLAPLLLMAHVSPTANQWFRADLAGIPLDAASRALPWSTWLRPGSLIHCHLHARSLTRESAHSPRLARAADTKLALIASLEAAITGISPRRADSSWSAYTATAHHYSPTAAQAKESLVADTLARLNPALVYDLGANTGTFSRLAVAAGASCVSFEADPVCVDAAYRRERANPTGRLLPLVMDLANPSPAVGFALTERLSVLERPTADLTLALALVHHLRLTANIPFARIAPFLRRLGRHLLIEYVDPHDPMAAALLAHRRQPLPADYTLEGFLDAFRTSFRLLDIQTIPHTARALLLWEAL